MSQGTGGLAYKDHLGGLGCSKVTIGLTCSNSCGALKHPANRRRPPANPTVGGGYTVGVELSCDRTKTLPGSACDADSIDHRGWNGRSATGPPPGATCNSGPTTLGRDPFEYIDGNQRSAPGQLDRLEVREQAVEAGAADAERLRCLRGRVGEPGHLPRHLDPLRRELGARLVDQRGSPGDDSRSSGRAGW